MDFKKQIADISDKLYVFQEDTECPAPACAVCEYVELCDRIMDLQTVIARFKNEGKL